MMRLTPVQRYRQAAPHLHRGKGVPQVLEPCRKPAVPGLGNGHGRRPAALRNASLILVCQPGPVARKWASTSGSSRSVVNSLGAAAFGRPPRRALANHSSVSSGTSTASQSSWLTWSGLGGVVAAFLSVIGFPQSDDA